MVKRIKTEHNIECSNLNSDSSDEGIQCHPSPGIESEPNIDELRAELVEVRKALDRERKLRMQLEEQVKMLESQLYPDKVREIAQQVQVKFCEVTKAVLKTGEDILMLVQSSFQGSSSQGNSESEEAAAVASLVDDEVIAETIEIETHSCPDSPSDHQPTTIVISAPSVNNVSAAPIQIQSSQSSRIITVAAEAKDLTRTKHNTKTPQPAAIALPIDVPFISAAGVPGGTVTLQIIGPTSTDNQTVNVSNTSRHNLETIVEAIRHLEGDHLFKDEDTTVTLVKQEFDEEELITGEEIITSSVDEEIELRTTDCTTKSVKHVLTVSPEQLGAIRQQVIQCSQSRPGVIVAKNP